MSGPEAEGRRGLGVVWRPFKDLLNVVRPAVWAPFFIGLLAAALFVPSQTRDLIRSLNDAPPPELPLDTPEGVDALASAIWDAIARFGPTSLGVAALGLSMWLAMRVSFVRKYPYTPEEKPSHRVVRRWTPRIAAIMPSLTFAAAFWAFGSIQMAIVQVIIGALLFLMLWFRRPLLRALFPWARPVRMEVDASTQPTRSADLKTLELMLVGYAALFLAPVFAMTIVKPVEAPQWFGTIGVATILFSFFIVILSLFYALIAEPILSLLRWVTGDRMATIPVLTVTIILILALNANSSRYYVPQTLPREDVREFEAPYLFSADRIEVAGTFADQWLAARVQPGRSEYTAYVVAAEGGGLRAAYWTAAVLSRWQDHDPCFASHVFVVSGVSGGALGAASFAAGLRATEAGVYEPAAGDCTAPPPASSLPVSGAEQGAIGPLERLTAEHLGADHLAPVIAGLSWNVVGGVAVGAAERFAPQKFDRGHYLELSWARAWEQALQSLDDYSAWSEQRRVSLERLFAMDGDFLDLWRPLDDPAAPPNVASPATPPALIFPTASVRTGEAWSISPVRITEEVERCAPPDLLEVMAGENLSTPGAAHMSARFTYISPAARLDFDHDLCEELGVNAEHERFVDGGYFEGSGADRALDAAQALEAAASRYPDLRLRIVPIIINTDVGPPPNGAATFLADLLAPPAALLQTRTARGKHAVDELTVFAGLREISPIVCTLPLTDGMGEDAEVDPVPLGWVLSNETKERITRAAAELLRPGAPPCAAGPAALRREAL